MLTGLSNAAKGLADTVGGGLKGAIGKVGDGLSGLADKAADVAADTALAPLKLIESSISSVANLGPDIVARRRAEINTMLTKIEDAAKAYERMDEEKRKREALVIVNKRIKEVASDSTIPKKIKNQFDAILAKKPPTKDKDGFLREDPGPNPEELLERLLNAEDALKLHENTEFSGLRLIKRAWRFSSEYIYYILLFTTAIFGGIILSNVYINESFLPIRLYYFFYGTAFFPISLMYGIINPPVWSATIFPGFKVPESGPFVQKRSGFRSFFKRKVGGAMPTDIQQGTGIVAERSAAFRSKEDIAASIKTAEDRGEPVMEAAKKELAALEATGVDVGAATLRITEVLKTKGISPEIIAKDLVLPKKPLTFEERITLITTDLFGYKMTGGSSLSLRITSLALSVITFGCAYLRGDISDILEKAYETYRGVRV
jgi:hypothetical protein